MRRILVRLYGILSIAILALALHGLTSAAVDAPHHGTPVVTNAGGMHTPEMDGCCDKGACCDPSHCNMCLAVERFGFGGGVRATVEAAPMTVPSGITISPQLGPPRTRA